VSVDTNSFELEGHGLGANASVSFRAEAGGSLTSPLVAGTRYYALVVDDDHFQVSLTSGGAAVDLLTTGSRVLLITPLPIDAKIEYASELIQDLIPSALLPLVQPYPRIVVMTCAELAAGALGYYAGEVSKSMSELLDLARKRLDRWSKGVPIRGTNAPVSAGLSMFSSRAARESGGYGGIG